MAWDRLDGTLQTDILKEYIAQKEWLFPPRPHLRLIGDLMAFCEKHVPRFHPDQRQRVPHPRGRRDRGPGARVHARGRVRLRRARSAARARRRPVRARGSRSSSTPTSTCFEEIGKYRAARRIWARWLRERYGATDDDAAMRLRFHTQTAGVSLTAQQPMNNVVRTARRGARGRARRHAVAAHERARRGPRAPDRARRDAWRSGPSRSSRTRPASPTSPIRSAARTTVESLDRPRWRSAPKALFADIDEMGEGSMLEGVLAGIERGWFQQLIAEAAFDEQRRFEAGDLRRSG